MNDDELKELKEMYAVVYPICFICQSDDKKPHCSNLANDIHAFFFAFFCLPPWGIRETCNQLGMALYDYMLHFKLNCSLHPVQNKCLVNLNQILR